MSVGGCVVHQTFSFDKLMVVFFFGSKKLMVARYMFLDIAHLHHSFNIAHLHLDS